jgi:hypothetical protein
MKYMLVGIDGAEAAVTYEYTLPHKAEMEGDPVWSFETAEDGLEQPTIIDEGQLMQMLEHDWEVGHWFLFKFHDGQMTILGRWHGDYPSGTFD